jgi:phosphoglycerate dehydrogenase-like enzyme
MDSVNVLVVYPIGKECLKQIAAVSPKIKVQDASDLWSCVGKDITEPKGDGLQEKRDSLLAQADILCGYTPPDNVALRAPRLKWIQTMLAGVNQFLNADLVQSRIILTTASGIQATPVSELALQMMLMLAKRAPFCFQKKQEKKWQRFITPMLRSQTVGIMGLGSIGREVARLTKCFGMRVLALDVKAVKSRNVDLLLTMEQLPKLLSESDFLVLTLPLTPETNKLIGEKELRAMKPTAYLVNVARGEIVDEKALVKALNEHWIAGAGLDVFAIEPLPAESPLWELPDVIISPHIAGTMVNYDKLATNLFCENLERYLSGKRLLNIINKKKGF